MSSYSGWTVEHGSSTRRRIRVHSSVSDQDACIKFWKKSLALRTAATPTAHATARRDVVNAFSVETTPSAQPADMAVPCADTGDSQDGRNPEVQNKFNQVERSWARLLIYPAQLRQLFEYLIELTKPG